MQKSLEDEYKFQMSLHGVTTESSSNDSNTTPTASQSTNVPLFGDVADYAKLSSSERDKMTTQMKAAHMKVMGDGSKAAMGT